MKKHGNKSSNKSRRESRASSPTSQRTATVMNFTNKVFSNASRPTPRVEVKFKFPAGESAEEFTFNCLPDTGATRSIVSYDIISQYNVPFHRTDRERLYVANGTSMECIGTVKLQACAGAQEVEIDAVISPRLNKDIYLSWHDMIALGIISDSFPQVRSITREPAESGLPGNAAASEAELEAIMEEFSDVVKDTLGSTVMKGPPMKIHLRDDVPFKPQRVLTTRQTPLHMQEEADKELTRLIARGHHRTGQRTDGLHKSELALSKKRDGKVRLITDLKINPFVKRPVHPIPVKSRCYPESGTRCDMVR
jgi:hypothetical protein